jgi:hypothetical protein
VSQNIQLRLDDVGASTKRFSQGGKRVWANIGPLKRLPSLQRWGPYDELTAADWQRVLEQLHRCSLTPLIAVTACWVTKDSRLIPFPEKFPEAAAVLKAAQQKGAVTIANHGLTHCVVGQHLPRFWSDNRKYHREFWPDLPENLHHEHIAKSQQILEAWLGQPVIHFVPPGNVWSIKTHRALKGTNIRFVIANRGMLDAPMKNLAPLTFVDDRNVYTVIHDRDIVLNTPRWRQILKMPPSATQ